MIVRARKPPKSKRITPGHVAVGRIAAVRGIRGELKVEPLAPSSVLASGRTVIIGGEIHQIAHARCDRRFAYVTLAGVDSREAASRVHGEFLEVLEGDLPPLPKGEFYRFQLIGLSVRGTNGQDLGRVTDVFSLQENDVYVVSGAFGEVLIPAVDEVVQSIDLEAGEILIEIIPGLLP